jgi:hypothetical protein
LTASSGPQSQERQQVEATGSAEQIAIGDFADAALDTSG